MGASRRKFATEILCAFTFTRSWRKKKTFNRREIFLFSPPAPTSRLTRYFRSVPAQTWKKTRSIIFRENLFSQKIREKISPKADLPKKRERREQILKILFNIFQVWATSAQLLAEYLFLYKSLPILTHQTLAIDFVSWALIYARIKQLLSISIWWGFLSEYDSKSLTSIHELSPCFNRFGQILKPNVFPVDA